MPKVKGRTKHVPQRTCIVCRTTSGKRDLVRIVRTPEGRAVPDPTGKAAGRGAYVCHKAECWDKVTKGRLLDKALKMTVTKADAEEIAAYAARIAEEEVV